MSLIQCTPSTSLSIHEAGNTVSKHSSLLCLQVTIRSFGKDKFCFILNKCYVVTFLDNLVRLKGKELLQVYISVDKGIQKVKGSWTFDGVKLSNCQDSYVTTHFEIYELE